MNYRILSLICFSTVMILNVYAADFVWDGGGSDSSWTNPANWSADAGFPGSGDSASFPQPAADTTISLNGDQAVSNLIFNPSAPKKYLITGNTLFIDHNAVVRFSAIPGGVPWGESAIQTIASAISLAGNVTFYNANSWYVGNEKLRLTGPVSGNGTITITGANNGSIDFAANNSDFSGNFIINSGMLLASHSGALGSGDSPIIMNGGSFWFGGIPSSKDFIISANAAWSSLGANGPHDGSIILSNGATWTVSNGGGNTMTLRGVVSGNGNMTITAGGTTFSGSNPNTLNGTVSVGSGSPTLNTTILAKPAGVDAIPGPLVMNTGGKLKWNADDQIADTSTLTFAGDNSILALNGHSEAVDTLNLQAYGFIDCANGDCHLFCADSRLVSWTTGKELVIQNWSGNTNGGDADQIYVGSTNTSLSAVQCSQIGFQNPDGFSEGLYTARLLPTGELVPGSVVIAVNPPFPIDDAAKTAREAFYSLPGLDLLTGEKTPLKDGMVIDFFGDSITWQDAYIKNIRNAITASPHTSDLGVTLVNRGINGGTSLDILDGKAGVQDSFATVISNDKPDVVVLFIGINDIWWAGTSAAAYEQALRDIIGQATNAAVPHFVLATPWLHNERPDGSNADDAKIEEFSTICSNVAANTGVTFVNLRHLGIAWLRNHNYSIRLDGSLVFKNMGLLTYDGVHATSTGNDYLANWLSYGIAAEMGVPEPAALTLAGIYGLLLLQRH